MSIKVFPWCFRQGISFLFAEWDWRYKHKEFHQLFLKYHTDQESNSHERKVASVVQIYPKFISRMHRWLIIFHILTKSIYSYSSLERISRDQVILCLRVKMLYSQYRKYYRKWSRVQGLSVDLFSEQIKKKNNSTNILMTQERLKKINTVEIIPLDFDEIRTKVQSSVASVFYVVVLEASVARILAPHHR